MLFQTRLKRAALVLPPSRRLHPNRHSPKRQPNQSGPQRSKYCLPILEILSVLIALGIWQWGKWQPLEHLAYTALFQSRQAIFPAEGWSDRLTIIAVDDATLEELNRFPLPRSDYADLLNTLNVSLPAAVGFDMLFAESTPDDAKFAEAIADNWTVVLALSDGLGNSSMTLVPKLAASAAATGHVHAQPDSDGMVRWVNLYNNNQVDGQRVPAFALAVLQVYGESLNATIGEAVPEMPRLPVVLNSDDAADQYLTRWGDRTAWINWPASVKAAKTTNAPSCMPEFEPGELQIYSFACVLNQQVPPEVFANKIVLIGTTAQGIDPLVTPFHYDVPRSGVFLHAALINNLLTDSLLRPLPRGAEGALIIVLGAAVAIAMRRLKLAGRLAILVGVPLLWYAGSVMALQENWWLPVAAPIGTTLLVFTGTQVRDQLEKQQLMHLFEIYVSPEAAQRIWRGKQHVLSSTSEVEKLVATILFVDIRRFTSISETLPPEQLMSWLNRYLDTMTTCIVEHGGWVDKYIGDEIMAVFGSPEAEPSADAVRDNARCAIAASLAMHNGLQRLNQEFMEADLPTIQFGIGIHTGAVAAGNLGGAKRYNYSIVGDTVNVASRLQGLNKEVIHDNPLHVLMSSATYIEVSDCYRGHPVGHLKLRGRSKEMLVYSLQEPREVEATGLSAHKL